MFLYCSSLNEITLNDSIKLIGENAFMGCASLAKFNVTKNVQTIGDGAFSACSNLERIDVEQENMYFHLNQNTL